MTSSLAGRHAADTDNTAIDTTAQDHVGILGYVPLWH